MLNPFLALLKGSLLLTNCSLAVFSLMLLSPLVSSAQETSGQLVIYLEKLQSPPPALNLRIQQIFLEGLQPPQELTLISREISTDDLTQQQILLSESMIAPAAYQGLRIIAVAGTDSPADTLAIPLNLTINTERAQAVFLQCIIETSPDTGATFTLRFHPVHKNIPPLTSLAFVTNEGSCNLSIIDRVAEEVVGCLATGANPRGVVYSRRSGLLFVANAGSNTISIFEALTLQSRPVLNLDYGDEPEALCLSQDERYLLVANRGSNSVMVIDQMTMNSLAKITVGSAPTDLTVDPNSGMIFVVNYLSDDVSVLDPVNFSVLQTLPVGSNPTAIELDKLRKVAYIANYNSGYITEIRTDQLAVSNQLSASRSVSGLAYESFSGALYGAVQNSNEISVNKPALNIDLASIPVGRSPAKLALNPESSRIYVACRKSNNLTVISRNTGRAERTIAAGLQPYMLVFP